MATFRGGKPHPCNPSSPPVQNREVNEHEIAALLASELNELSLGERSQILEEIHGVEPLISETPEVLAHSIQELREAINFTPESERTAFELGRSMSDYVASESFLLMFLRSERFDVSRSALRLLRFLEEKRELFGSGDVLGRPLRLSDLNEQDMQALRWGVYQILSSRDSAGRCVLVDFAVIFLKEIACQRTPISNAKALLVVCTAIAEGDVEMQKRGAVVIHYFVGTFNGQFNRALTKRSSQILNCVPLRFNSFHRCSSDPRLIPVMAIAELILGKKHRLRVRVHQGSHTECRYGLMTYGIPVETLPISQSGAISTKYWNEWIARLQFKEEYCARMGIDFDGIGVPGAFDVLLRRGQLYNHHPGNIRYREFIESKQDAYQQANQKAVFCKDFVKEMHDEYGSRFLKYATIEGVTGGLSWWWEVPPEEAAQRVSKAILHVRSLQLKVQNRKHHHRHHHRGLFPIPSSVERPHSPGMRGISNKKKRPNPILQGS